MSIYIVNWYVTERLEEKLASTLGKNIADATGGFYQLSFKKLSIGLFSGELSIENLVLKPDSAVFSLWETNDSLPKEYVHLEIAKINFKGINLKFRKNFRHLNFSLFEIQSPTIEMVKPLASHKSIKEKSTSQIDDPYSFIAKYVDILSVEKLNLDNATISYIAEDSIKSSIYGLKNFDFHAYKFRLDKNSFLNGKLLYCDHFDFLIDTPQTLLSNSDFDITVNEIRLDTQDSIIHIKKLSLDPQKEFWLSQNQKPSRFLNVKLDSLNLNGIAFSQEEGLRSLQVNLFLLSSPQIKIEDYFHKPTPDIPSDTIKKALSLYKILSPVINRLAINTIKLNNAKLNYSYTSNGGTDEYALNKLNFHVEQFLVDSARTSTFNFLHCNHFAFDAHKLEGKLVDKNHGIKVEMIMFDSKNENLRIKDLSIHPLSELDEKKADSMSGEINLIDVLKVNYNEDSRRLTASEIRIASPNINYTQIAKHKKKKDAKKDAIISGILNELFIKKINIKEANISFYQRDGVYTDTYSAQHLNATISDLSINKKLNIKDIGLNIGSVESDLSKSEIKFSAHNINFSSLQKSTISAKNINISKKRSEIYIPLLSIDGADLFDPNKLSFSSIKIEKPSFKHENSFFSSDNLLLKTIEWDKTNKSLQLSHLLVPNAEVRQTSPTSNIDATISLRIDNATWNEKLLAVNGIDLKSPVISYTSTPTPSKKNTDKVSFDPYKFFGQISEVIQVQNFDFTDANINIESLGDKRFSQKLNKTSIQAKGVSIDAISRTHEASEFNLSSENVELPLDNGFYTLKLGKIFADLKRSNLSLNNMQLMAKYPKLEFAYHHPKRKDWFGVSIGDINLSGIDIPAYFNNKKLYINDIVVSDVELNNFKNQKIEIEHNIMPMIYDALYKMPIKFDVKKASVTNFNVCYEELTKSGTSPGKIFFSNLNGEFSGLTNIPTDTSQYITLYANGLFMGSGYLEAIWKIPASPLNDHFNLKGTLYDFDLTELNQLIQPMAPARIESGLASSLYFDMDATSKGAHIDMEFLYKNLKVSAWSTKNDKVRYQNVFSRLANSVIKHDNPNKRSKHPRIAQIDMERDPYHSTFNYLWQILQPATIESVGISQKRQNRLQQMANTLNKIKHFFKPQKEKKIKDSDKSQ